jgi:hypothetical protein
MTRRLAMGLLLLALPTAALAEPKQPARSTAKPEASQPLKSQPQRNPCAAYGQNFVAIEGTSTCVQIGGSISVGVGATR